MQDPQWLLLPRTEWLLPSPRRALPKTCLAAPSGATATLAAGLLGLNSPSVEPPSTAAVAFGASRGGDGSFGAGVASRDELVDDDVELTAAPPSPGDGSPALGPGFCSTVLAAATTVFGPAGSPDAVAPAITLPAAPATTAAPI
jgi:hypothetical protein